MLNSFMQRTSAGYRRGTLPPIIPGGNGPTDQVSEPDYTYYVGENEQYKTLYDAYAVLATDQSIGIRPETFQIDENTPILRAAQTQIRGVGSGQRPLITGVKTIGSWEAYTTTATNLNLIPNGDCENTTPDSRNRIPTGWHAFTAGGSYVSADTSIKHSGNTSSKMLIQDGTLILDVWTSASIPAQTAMTWKFWLKAAEDGQNLDYVVQQSGNSYLQADKSWGSNEYKNTLILGTNWAEQTVTFTPNVDGKVKVLLHRSGSTNAVIYTDDWSVLPSSPIPSSPNTYRAPLSSTPGTLTRNGDFLMSVPQGGDRDRLPNNTWSYEDSYLYMRSDNGTSGDWKVSQSSTGVRYLNAPGVVVSNLDFSYVRNRGVFLDNCNGSVIEDVTCDYVGAQHQFSSSNGSLYTFQSDDIRISRVRLTNINTDAINHLGGLRPIVEDFYSTMSYGNAGDALQFDASGNIENGNPIVRHFYSSQIGSPSPKGTMVTFLNNGIYEHGHVLGGHFGLSVAASYSTTRGCVSEDVDGLGFGVSSNSEPRTGNVVEDSLALNCKWGVACLSGTEVNFTTRRVTTVNCDRGFHLNVSDFTGSRLEDSIIWKVNRTSAVLEITGNAPFTNLTIKNCIIGPEIPGVSLIKWGTSDYSTIAAFVAAGGKMTNCSSADPQFENRDGIPYQLASGSPALTMGTGGTRIGCDTAALRVGPRWAPGGALLPPTWPA